MEGAIINIGRTHEPSVRPQNADVFLRHGSQEQGRTTETERNKSLLGESPERVPTSYMLLISRIDNMIRQSRLEHEPVEQLGQLLSEKIARMTVSSRRTLQELPEFQALDVENPMLLPRAITDRIQSGTEQASVMELLRSPSFAAMIKDESRIATYGPRGLLRAS